MSDDPIKSQHYALIIDEKSNAMLQMIYSAAMQHPAFSGFFRRCVSLGHFTEEDWKLFKEEISKKEHGFGWCKDPDCELNEPKSV